MPVKLLDLSDTQKARIMEMLPTHTLSAITQDVFQNPALKGTSIEGVTVRTYLAGEGKRAPTTADIKGEASKAEVRLTEAQKKQIEELGPKVDNCLELSRLVYGNPQLKQMSREYRAVWTYYQTVYPNGADASDEVVSDERYEPPTTLAGLVNIVNDMVPTGTGKRLYGYPLKAHEDKQLKMLMANMRILRFKYQANQYKKTVDRNLYLSTFIRFTHDKPDLTQTEVDQYISAAVETLNIIWIERQLQDIDQALSDMMSGDRETRGQFMPMVDLINTTRAKLDISKERLRKLIDGLEDNRSTRIKERDNRSNSVIYLFDAWRTSEDVRADLLKLGQKEHEEDAQEVDRLDFGLDDMTALIAGQRKVEASVG